MASRAEAYKRVLSGQLAEALGGGWQHHTTSRMLTRPVEGGQDVLAIAGSNKWSPHIAVDYYFGKQFDVAAAVERRLGSKEASSTHIVQYSLNVRHMNGLGVSDPAEWRFDLTSPPPDLVSKMVCSVQTVAEPFFARYPSVRSARDAIAAKDPWCFHGPFVWASMLALDLALGDSTHFEQWMSCMTQTDTRKARELLAKWERMA